MNIPIFKPRNSVSSGSVLGGVAGFLFILFIGLPILALLVRAAQQESFWGAVTGDLALTALRLSIFTSVVSVAIVVAAGTPFAYLLARSDHWLARVVDGLVELPIVLPPVVAGVAMLMAFGRGGIIGGLLDEAGISISFTTTAVVFAQIFVAAPFYIRSAKLGFQSVARDYEDVSQTLGVSPLFTFLRITLPLAAPAIITGLGLSWARALSEFGATIIVRRQPDGRDPDHAARHNDRYGNPAAGWTALWPSPRCY